MRAHRIRAGLVVLGSLVVAGPIFAIGCAQAALEDELTPLDSGTDVVVKPVADAAKDHGYGNASDSAGPVVDTGLGSGDTGATGGEDASVDAFVPVDATPDVTVPPVDAGIDSPADAIADVAADVAVDAPTDAIADAIADVAIDTGCPVVCGAQSACVVGVCSPARRVFVSSKGFTGNLGGAAGADATCQTLATAASLGGTWMAWISDSTSSPSTRFTKSTDPYRLIDGTLVASNWTSLTSSSLTHAIDHDEHLSVVSNSEVWTATSTSGALYSAGCSGFTAATSSSTVEVGISGKTDLTWTNVYSQFCNRTDPRLYCFEQ